MRGALSPSSLPPFPSTLPPFTLPSPSCPPPSHTKPLSPLAFHPPPSHRPLSPPPVRYIEFCLEQIVKDNELGALSEALNGEYVQPGPGGDPIRNPLVLPTGKNIHALDPQSIPTQAALKSALMVVDRLLDREKDNNGGKYPETIALVLWGTDNIKTYGESLAQVMMMVGIRPVPDALGRVNKLEVMSLEELGRPRVDVVVNCSGVFRDLFVNQVRG